MSVWGTMGILWLPFHINSYKLKHRDLSILAEENFSVKENILRNWGAESSADLLRWGNEVHLELVSAGMQQCCLNKALDSCYCRCWRWQSVVIEGLYDHYHCGADSPTQQAINLYFDLDPWVWGSLSGLWHRRTTQSCVRLLVWLTTVILYTQKTIFTSSLLWSNLWCVAAELLQKKVLKPIPPGPPAGPPEATFCFTIWLYQFFVHCF